MKQLVALAGFALAATATSAQFFDDFNRPDSGTLGPNWTMVNGSIGIVNNQAMAPNADFHYAVVNGYSDLPGNTVVSFDVFHAQNTVTYAAAMLGIFDSNNSIFIKVQDNGIGGTYNRAFFYIGNAGSGGSLGYDDLVPFVSGHVQVSYSGTVATLSIDTNFDNIFDQTYSRDYVGTTLGTGAGLGAYGDGKIDNYGINAAVPEPATVAVLGIGLAALLRRRRA